MKLPEGHHDARRLGTGEFGRAEPRDTTSWVPSQRPRQVRGMVKLFELHRDSFAGTNLGQDPHREGVMPCSPKPPAVLGSEA